TALDALHRCVADGRLAHAYLIHGPVRGAAGMLAEAFLQFFFCHADRPPCGVCPECRRVIGHTHPDVLWLEPESKSRQIVIGADENEGIRKVVRFIALSPFSGPRKAAVILDAERMNPQAANAFLKTLEEPPANSLILLLSEAPAALLPTIVSRCQKIDLSAEAVAPGAWLEPLLEWLRAGPAEDALRATARAGGLRHILAEEKEKIEVAEQAAVGSEDLEEEVFDARIAAKYRGVRAAIFRSILHWHRDVLLRTLALSDAQYLFPAEATAQLRQARQSSPTAALNDVRRLETLIRRLDQFPAASEQVLLELDLPQGGAPAA
ncbi:MAG: DNA polymerase III subunit, partial [Kiritimatiellaeota bacterium]|nr:DNA polymerase III subunit [Kiritimatiellota bacterium]